MLLSLQKAVKLGGDGSTLQIAPPFLEFVPNSAIPDVISSSRYTI